MSRPGWLLCMLLAHAAVPALSAQVPTVAATQTSGAESAAAEPVPAERASARATMRSFLEALAAEPPDFDQAIATLDLSNMPANVRQIRGRELAVQLKDVIDRIRLVRFEEIPATGSEPYTFSDQIVIAPDGRGEWRFTAATVAAIPRLFDSYASRDVVEGVTEAPRTVSMWLRAKVPERMREVAFLLEYWQWSGLAILIFVGIIVERLGLPLLELVVSRRLRRQFLTIEAELVRNSLRPLALLGTAAVWWVGIAWLGLPQGPLAVLHLAVEFFATVAVVWAAYRLVDLGAEIAAGRAARTDNRFDDLLVPMLRKSAKVFIAAFGIIFIAQSLDLPITSLITGIGLGGVAFALAGQDVVKNLFGSITVLLDRPFHVGDWIVTQGLEGTVEEVGFRSTRIRTFYNSLITLPNSTLLNAAVDNYGERQYRRWRTVLSITYETPPERIDAFCEGIRELVRQHPYTRKDYYHVYLNEFGAASIDVLLYVFFVAPDWGTELRERHRLAVDILRLAARLGVDFAYPTQTLYLQQATADGQAAEDALEYGGRVAAAVDQGRDEARGLVESVLQGIKPPPVVITAADASPGEAE